MSETLIFFIYLINLFSKLEFVINFSQVVLLILTVLSGIAVLAGADMHNSELIESIFKYVKRFAIALVIISVIDIFIPNERTLYAMAGVYTVDKAMDTETAKLVSERTFDVLDKTFDMIDKRLEEEVIALDSLVEGPELDAGEVVK